MRTNQELLKELFKKESQEGLDVFTLKGILLGRILRFPLRTQYLFEHSGSRHETKDKQLKAFHLLKNYLLSFFRIVQLFFFQKRISTIIMAFPRLTRVNGLYVDKFTDPVIAAAGMQDYLIFQRSLSGGQLKPRVNAEKVVYTDFIDVSARLYALLTFWFYQLRYKKKIAELNGRFQRVYGVRDYKRQIALALAETLFTAGTYGLIFKRLRPQNLIGVSRMVFVGPTLAAKKRKMATFEMQHGITNSESALYYGHHDAMIDPDFFLVFGKVWINDYFGIPKERISNIGWAYKNYIMSELRETNVHSSGILLISSPSITDKILQLAKMIDEFNVNCEIHIRLHPQESLTLQQQQLIVASSRIAVADSTVSSAIAVAGYSKIIGDNSTVLFEALSLKKQVGKLNMLGIKSRNLEEDRSHGFRILETAEDVLGYITDKEEGTGNAVSEVYSDFNKEEFNRLITSKK